MFENVHNLPLISIKEVAYVIIDLVMEKNYIKNDWPFSLMTILFAKKKHKKTFSPNTTPVGKH